MIIEERMLRHIKKNAVATIGSDGLVGSMIVNIVPGEGPGAPVAPGDEITSFSRLSANDMLSTLNVTNENAALLTADLLKVTHSLVNGKGTIGRLLNDSVMAEDLYQTLNNLKVVSAEARMVIGELHGSFASEEWEQSVAGVLLTDSVSGQKVKSLLVHLEHSGEELATTVQAMDSLVTGISRGEGAIHYLSQDTVFVNRLSRTMESIEEGAERFNQNMEALKHNFLTRGYFRRLERQQAKDAKNEN